MLEVDQKQFVFQSDICVIHRPTGSKFTTDHFANPEETRIKFINWGRDGALPTSGSDYSRAEVLTYAKQLLLERARERVRKRV
ncbi:MAG: hypothetical protein KKH72_01200 [Alphaproteobacteria bacterium]|nr:hypothetical protein [Alphaproteobacteria bacterium]